MTVVRLVIAMAIAALMVPAAPAEASGFVYTVDVLPCSPLQNPPPGCQLNPTFRVVVVDADTGLVVTRITLPPVTRPVGMALSPNGTHLYVAGNDIVGAGMLTVIDARHHTLTGTLPLGRAAAGGLAVSGDDSRVFAQTVFDDHERIESFDTASHTLTSVVETRSQSTGAFGRHFSGLLVDSLTNRLIVSETGGFPPPWVRGS
jgi:DNA-binding beta-propeller fold protein YncE